MAEDERELRSTIEQLAHLRDDFSDEVPKETIHSNSRDNRFKVRRGWFAGVAATISTALDEGLVGSPETVREANEFVDWVFDGDFKTRDPRSPTSAEEVQKANTILDRILGRGEKK